ncbi:hypothetical protein NDU88_004514 [Pleurodeles waltl]|uniref:Small integral membrane protein 36 n=1 Tax=Pleurodeles waltl TaxID=8319 RepID=A0AAV7NPJ3_PLEWA|nr:hypothetical protein NDU88_004514 [Pleurodeles waltl]
MQSLISPVTKAILVALFIFAILLILYVILCAAAGCSGPGRDLQGSGHLPLRHQPGRESKLLLQDPPSSVSID